jgi:hypothetical protein
MINNVFEVFIEDSLNYNIIDMEIAEGPTGSWSYPTWPSHLDHIIITNELFEDFEEDNSLVETLLIENNMQGGFNTYENYISDHRAVALKISANVIYLNIEKEVSVDFNIYPNPADNFISIVNTSVVPIEEVRIYNMNGQSVIHQVENYSTINISELKPGMYIVSVQTNIKNVRYKIIVQ